MNQKYNIIIRIEDDIITLTENGSYTQVINNTYQNLLELCSQLHHYYLPTPY